jgi:hypothetical protein
LSQPEIHDLSCRDCLQWIYDPDKNWAPTLRGDQKQRRFTPPPCKRCPKQSPAKAHQFEISARNIAAVRHFLMHRAMNFAALSELEKRDPIVQRNFEIIDQVFREFEKASERAYETQRMATLLTAAVPGVKK